MPQDLSDGRFRWRVFSGKSNGRASNESRIAVGERAVAIVEGKYGPIALTIDRNLEVDDSPNPFHLRSTRRDYHSRAGEGIFRLPNGFHGYFLVGESLETPGQYELQPNAPPPSG